MPRLIPRPSIRPPNLTYFTYSATTWPTGWTELHIPFRFNLSVLGPNSRLGFAIQVEKAGTSGGGMQFLYDEPSFDSRLELKTQLGPALLAPGSQPHET